MTYFKYARLIILVLLAVLSAFHLPSYAQKQPTSPPVPHRQAPERSLGTSKEIDQLIRRLGSNEFSEREAAGETLAAIGIRALEPLQKAQRNGEAEVRLRARDLISRIRSRERDKAWSDIRKLGATVNGKGVAYASKDTRDQDLAPLQWMDDLEMLFVFAPVTDAGLAPVEGCKNLTYLMLRSSQVTDAGLVHLKGLQKLKHLDLMACRITDTGLAHLKELPELSHLNLWQTRVTDKGLQYLKKEKGARLVVTIIRTLEVNPPSKK